MYTKFNLLRTYDTDENKIQKYKKYNFWGGIHIKSLKYLGE